MKRSWRGHNLQHITLEAIIFKGSSLTAACRGGGGCVEITFLHIFFNFVAFLIWWPNDTLFDTIR